MPGAALLSVADHVHADDAHAFYSPFEPGGEIAAITPRLVDIYVQKEEYHCCAGIQKAPAENFSNLLARIFRLGPACVNIN